MNTYQFLKQIHDGINGAHICIVTTDDVGKQRSIDMVTLETIINQSEESVNSYLASLNKFLITYSDRDGEVYVRKGDSIEKVDIGAQLLELTKEKEECDEFPRFFTKILFADASVDTELFNFKKFPYTISTITKHLRHNDFDSDYCDDVVFIYLDDKLCLTMNVYGNSRSNYEYQVNDQALFKAATEALISCFEPPRPDELYTLPIEVNRSCFAIEAVYHSL